MVDKINEALDMTIAKLVKKNEEACVKVHCKKWAVDELIKVVASKIDDIENSVLSSVGNKIDTMELLSNMDTKSKAKFQRKVQGLIAVIGNQMKAVTEGLP